MDASFVPFIQTEVAWATEHRWKPGDGVSNQIIYRHALWLVSDGALCVTAGGRRIELTSGTACFAPSGLERSLQASDGGAVWLSIGLQANLFGRVNLFQAVTAPLVWKPAPDAFRTLTDWMRRVADERETASNAPSDRQEYFDLVGLPTQPRGTSSALIGDGLGRALLGLCWDALNGEARLRELRPMTPDWLFRTLAHIQAHPETSVHDLESVAGFSAAQFRRVFHQWVGASPQEYVSRCRLEEARRLLITTDLLVSVVAARVGFQSLSHFTSLFHARFGTSPARYRQRLRTTGDADQARIV